MWRAIVRIAIIGLIFTAGAAAQNTAPNVHIYVVDLATVANQSAMGRAIRARALEDQADLERVDKDIKTQLEAREQELSAARATLEPAEFQKQAEKYDKDVQAARANFADLSQSAVDDHNARFNRFVINILPGFADDFRRNRNIPVLIDRRVVLSVDQQYDVTSEFIGFLDALYVANKAAIDEAIFSIARGESLSGQALPGAENLPLSLGNTKPAPSEAAKENTNP